MCCVIGNVIAGLNHGTLMLYARIIVLFLLLVVYCASSIFDLVSFVFKQFSTAVIDTTVLCQKQRLEDILTEACV